MAGASNSKLCGIRRLRLRRVSRPALRPHESLRPYSGIASRVSEPTHSVRPTY